MAVLVFGVCVRVLVCVIDLVTVGVTVCWVFVVS